MITIGLEASMPNCLITVEAGNPFLLFQALDRLNIENFEDVDGTVDSAEFHPMPNEAGQSCIWCWVHPNGHDFPEVVRRLQTTVKKKLDGKCAATFYFCEMGRPIRALH